MSTSLARRISRRFYFIAIDFVCISEIEAGQMSAENYKLVKNEIGK